MWQAFFRGHNGRSMILPGSPTSSDELALFTDAAGGAGFGAIFGPHWCLGTWHEQVRGANIAILELYPIVLAVELWGTKMSDSRIVFLSDNTAVVSILNSHTTKEPLLLCLLRRLVLLSLRLNFVFSGRHIPGHKNVAADLLSRGQMRAFLDRFGGGRDPVATRVPSHLTLHSMLHVSV